MKCCGVTIQMKPLQQYFHMVLQYLSNVSNFESVDEIVLCDHSNQLLQQYFHMRLFSFRYFSLFLGIDKRQRP